MKIWRVTSRREGHKTCYSSCKANGPMCEIPGSNLGWIVVTVTEVSRTFLNSHLLTYSMVQSPSWEANWFVASQEIPRISRNPKVHYRTHKHTPPVSILGQPNPVHIPTSHLLEIHPNIIHPSTPRSPQWSPSLRFPSKTPLPPHTVLLNSLKQLKHALLSKIKTCHVAHTILDLFYVYDA